MVKQLFNNIYEGRKVLITGHTGFKGSWLTYWLQQLGANICGISLDVLSEPNHFELLNIGIRSEKADIRNFEHLNQLVQEFQPEIIFHLAAQSLVRYSYQNPLETFGTNLMGTANVFEAARNCKSVHAIVNITSDKCYENFEIDIAYKETDRMGGYDPYSASKGCAELLASSYRNSFFNTAQYGKTHQILLACARAGNVIGGGDWAEDRLIPDIIKASVNGQPVRIRNPHSTRPWQHVLEPLSGYLLLGSLMLKGNIDTSDGWNFGPMNDETLTVEAVLGKMKQSWNSLQYEIEKKPKLLHEANLLRLDCTKANGLLKWFPVWEMDIAIQKTARWYKAFYTDGSLLTGEDLNEYVITAKSRKLDWAL